MIHRCLISAVVLGVFAASSQASVFFDNFVYSPSLFPSAPVNAGNALTWYPSSAATVGDLSAGRILTVAFSFDATSTTQLTAVSTLGQVFKIGSGASNFKQTVYSINNLGNITGTLATLSSGSVSNVLAFAPNSKVRVASSFELTAPDAAGFDYSGLSLVNQNVTTVPGPAALLPFVLGGLGVFRRRRISRA